VKFWMNPPCGILLGRRPIVATGAEFSTVDADNQIDHFPRSHDNFGEKPIIVPPSI
jgi:hypothetical protein